MSVVQDNAKSRITLPVEAIFKACGGELLPVEPGEVFQICYGPTVLLVEPIELDGERIEALQFWGRVYTRRADVKDAYDALILEDADEAEIRRYIIRRTISVLMYARRYGAQPVPGTWADALQESVAQLN